MSGQMKPFRSLLFVPGSRPERFAKAIAAGADAVCIDLEDAVPPQDKDSARAAVVAFIEAMSEDRPCAIGVRINPFGTHEGEKDVQAFHASPFVPDFIMVPKAVSAEDLAALPASVGEPATPIWAVVESVEGLLSSAMIAQSCAPHGGILFGGADFSAEMGTSMDWEPLLYARGNLVVAAKGALVQIMDVPYLDVTNTVGLESETTRVKALGFTAKACIHPSQVAPVNAIFSPTQNEVDWAKRVVAAGQSATGNAVLLDGKLLDRPVYIRAQNILTQAGIET
jgi:citrate lyase beta subunit